MKIITAKKENGIIELTVISTENRAIRLELTDAEKQLLISNSAVTFFPENKEWDNLEERQRTVREMKSILPKKGENHEKKS